MTKISLLFSTLILIGCSKRTLEPVTRDSNTIITTLIFNEYLEKGFEFSTYPPSGEFSIVGILDAELQPKIIPINFEQDKPNFEVTSGDTLQIFEVKMVWVNSENKKYGVQTNLDPNQLLRDIYTRGVGLGANGVADLDFYFQTKNTNGLDFEVLKAKGVFIKSY